jgi:hypothetical protein
MVVDVNRRYHMRRLGRTLAATCLTTTFVIGATPSAVADTPGCVSKAEFRSVKNGWAMKRVHRVFDTKGKQTFFTNGYQSREYRPCKNPTFSFVIVNYEKTAAVWRVTSKSAYWG